MVRIIVLKWKIYSLKNKDMMDNITYHNNMNHSMDMPQNFKKSMTSHLMDI